MSTFSTAIQELEAELDSTFKVAAVIQRARFPRERWAVTILYGSGYQRNIFTDTFAEAKAEVEEAQMEAAEAEYEAGLTYCSICDGLGHSICPLEERGYWDAREEEMMAMDRGLLY